jgi:hypothetical protein
VAVTASARPLVRAVLDELGLNPDARLLAQARRELGPRISPV